MKVNIGPYPKQNEDKERKIKVEIDHYDTWSLDTTLGYVILPALKKFKEVTVSSWYVDAEDVPESLRDTEEDLVKIDQNLGEVTNKHFLRSAYVLDEMIFAFEKIVEDDLYDDETDARLVNGLRLFGKYYRALWN